VSSVFHAADAFISLKPNPTLDSLLRHKAHIAEIGGPDWIGIGPDLMENWDPTVFTTVAERSSTLNGISAPRMSGLIQRACDRMPLGNLTEALLKLGFARRMSSSFWAVTSCASSMRFGNPAPIATEVARGNFEAG